MQCRHIEHSLPLLQMVAMEERPEAFVGIAAVDRGENDNPSSAG
jgi:hypothetical protein